MKKVTDFIVEKRNVFLCLFIILAGISLYLSTKVNINEDIMKYLPESSETKIGNDIMNEEFNKQDTSILNVMFKNLSEEEKEETLNKLKNIEGVSSVDYQKTEEYNIDEYSLFVINVDDYADSTTAENVYKIVENDFDSAGMSGSIYDANKPILHTSIVVIAICCAMVILIILSESYVEPFLYLMTIGIAVFINKGTNIMFESVSSITDSITAILQLALSMDYSIMLSNRFKQEKENTSDKIKAMKNALYQSFKSISSSSVTTIVGLLALVFMSFTIGRDLGFVLSKGVLLSLICIFVCLPALLLLFDNLIQKTHKKSPNFNLTKLGRFSYKTRWLQTVAIIVLFVVAYFLQGNTSILYTGAEQDQVGQIFPATNQIAIVYENKYEELISSYCNQLESDQKIDQVLCYSNTINEKLSYDALNQKLESLGQETNIEEYLVKLIYYYYHQKESDGMTMNEFITFIQSDISSNEKFSDSITAEIKASLNLLSKFSNPSEMNKARSMNEIAFILGMNKSDAENILIYYNSKNVNTKMTLKQFVNFMLTDVVKNPKYSSNLDKNTIASLKQLQNFTDTSLMNRKMNAKELSTIFGIDENVVEQLFLFYRMNIDSDSKMTLNTFATFALGMAKNDNYKSMFNQDTIHSLTLLKTLSNESFISNKLDQNKMSHTLSNLGLSLEEDTLNLLYILYDGNHTNTKMTLNAFASQALEISKLSNLESYFTDDVIASLETILSLNPYKDVSMNNQTLYQLFGITDSAKITQLNYILSPYDGSLTPYTFVQTLLGNEQIKNALQKEEIANLTQALYIMENTNTEYSMNELAKTLNQNTMMVSVIYGMQDEKANQIPAISVKDLIHFLYANQKNPLFVPYIKSNLELLKMANLIMNHTKTQYSYVEISAITSTSSNKVKQIFSVYDYLNKETVLTPLEFTNLILNNVDHELLSGKLDKSSLSKLTLVNQVMMRTLNNTSVTSSQVSNLLGIDKDTVSLLFSLYNSIYIKANQKVSLNNYVHFIVEEVMNNENYASQFDEDAKEKLTTISSIMQKALNKEKYSPTSLYSTLKYLNDNLEQSLIELVYIYQGSINDYDSSWTMTVEEFVNYLNSTILTDEKFDDFIDKDMKSTITDAKSSIDKAKQLIVSDHYSRVVLNTKYPLEGEETSHFIKSLEEDVGTNDGVYIVGNSSIAVEMSRTFNDELNKITLLTMIFIFIVVAITFKSLLIPFILVLVIQCAVYITMSFISLTGGSVYFISLLIVQAILMGATIDYAIVYTSYYKESRLTMNVKDSIINAYNKSIHTIISSSSILIIVTLIVANFASAIAAKICETISQGAFASVILILLILPGVLASCDKFICKNK